MGPTCILGQCKTERKTKSLVSDLAHSQLTPGRLACLSLLSLSGRVVSFSLLEQRPLWPRKLVWIALFLTLLLIELSLSVAVILLALDTQNTPFPPHVGPAIRLLLPPESLCLHLASKGERPVFDLGVTGKTNSA